MRWTVGLAIASAMGIALFACASEIGVADVVLIGGMVADGSEGDLRAVSVAISGAVVTGIGSGAMPAKDTVDAAGRIVAPGFIDVHSHVPPAMALRERRLNEGAIRQGVTTVIGGPDGGLSPEEIRRLASLYRAQGIGINVGFYVGHNAVRREVMGADQRRAPKSEELDAMRAQVREGMEWGALGFSTGLMYEPGMFSAKEEVIELARESARAGGVYDSHVRDPVNDLLGSDAEVVDIAHTAGLPAKIGHLKAVGLHNEGLMSDVVALVEAARAQGIDVVADQYPYDGAATASVADIIVAPPQLGGLENFRGMQGGEWTRTGLEELKDALSDPKIRAVLHDASENGIDGGFAWLKATGYTSMRITSSVDYSHLVGAYLSEIARERGLAPFDALSELVLGAQHPVQLTLGAIKEHDVRTLLVQPWAMVASDGAYADGSDSSWGHPRSAGTFARLLGHYVRDEGVLPLEEAVRKVTSLPAEFHGISDRGRIEVGMRADVVVFDPERIGARSDWEYPQRFATGVTDVLVNGVFVLRNGRMTQAAPGELVRR